jgi:two-component system cell cycle sensor histidine kinase/response regulator CckA
MTPTEKGAAEGRYQTLFNHAPDGIIIADPDGVYLDANPSLYRMLGYSPEEFLGKTAAAFVLPEEQPHIAPALETIHNAKSYNRQWRFRRKDGTIFRADVTATKMPDGNILAMVRDLSDYERLEKQFLHAQRMESVGRLAGGIAHDLNNVLTPILMSTELLQEDVQSDDGRDLLETIRVSAQRGADLLKQVLSFSRGMGGERVTVDPSALLRDLVTVTRETFPRSIIVCLEEAEHGSMIQGDPTQLHQIFLNLLVNARDAMPEGGRLTITVRDVAVDETFDAMHFDSRSGNYVRIAVSDTGVGVPPELRDKIFEPFFTTKDFGLGTGLGLSTTVGIVKSHGGFMHLQSEVGYGSQFSVYLPALSVDRPVKEESLPRNAAARGQAQLILVVDDEAAICQIAARTLESHGYRVLQASNGAEAVALFVGHQENIAAVLTDMAMPVMDGAALIIALRTVDPFVKVIASSGHADREAVETRATADRFITKPYSAETLLCAVAEVLDEAR